MYLFNVNCSFILLLSRKVSGVGAATAVCSFAVIISLVHFLFILYLLFQLVIRNHWALYPVRAMCVCDVCVRKDDRHLCHSSFISSSFWIHSTSAIQCLSMRLYTSSSFFIFRVFTGLTHRQRHQSLLSKHNELIGLRGFISWIEWKENNFFVEKLVELTGNLADCTGPRLNSKSIWASQSMQLNYWSRQFGPLAPVSSLRVRLFVFAVIMMRMVSQLRRRNIIWCCSIPFFSFSISLFGHIRLVPMANINIFSSVQFNESNKQWTVSQYHV